MPKDDYFRICYVILTFLKEYFEKGEPTDTIPIREKCGIQDAYWQNVCVMMYENGLIENVKATKAWGGNIVYFDADNMKITLKGLEYLAENSSMKKVHKILKGIKEVVPFT